MIETLTYNLHSMIVKMLILLNVHISAVACSLYNYGMYYINYLQKLFQIYISNINLKLQGKQMKVAFDTLDHDIDHGLGFSMQSACTCVN